MNIHIATTDTEIAACYPVMWELRPNIAEDQFLSRVRSQENVGYRLAFVQVLDGVVTVAGFRVIENLAWGRFLYVDDLVTLPAHRSNGYGAKLLMWLKDYSIKKGCLQLHLDTGVQRKEAHRFYEREGMTMAGLHYVENVAPNKVLKPTPKPSAALSCPGMVSGLEYGFAALDELPRIVEVKVAMFHEAGHADLLAQNAKFIILEDYQKLYGEKTAQHFVARANGRIVATVGVFIKSDLPYRYFLPAYYGFIGDVYTEPAYRGKGVATKLNREALEWLISRGIKSVRLLASDTARSMYERLGFSTSDEMVFTFAT